MAGSSKRTARARVVKDWHAVALDLRVSGHTVREIAAKVGKAASTVHEAIEAELRNIPASGVLELREVEGARLDALIRGHMAKARKGDAEAAHVVIAAVRQRSKLFGLEAPTRNEHTGKDGGPIAAFDMSKLSDAQIERLIAGDTSVLEGDDAPGAEGASEG
jgi:hypothetical protein